MIRYNLIRCTVLDVLFFALLGRVAELVGCRPAPLLALAARRGGRGGSAPGSQGDADVADLQLVAAEPVQHQTLVGVARRPPLAVHEVRVSKRRLELHLRTTSAHFSLQPYTYTYTVCVCNVSFRRTPIYLVNILFEYFFHR